MAERLFKGALVVEAAILVALTVKHQVEKSWRSTARKEMAFARCEGQGEADRRARVDARHERCFERSDEVGQTRVTPGGFDDEGYLGCIAEGARGS